MKMKITLTIRQIMDMYAAALRDRKYIAHTLAKACKSGTCEISVDAHDIKELKALAWTEYCLALEIKSEFAEQYRNLYRYLDSKQEEDAQKVLQYLGW